MQVVEKPKAGATDPSKRFSGLETYKLVQVQPLLDPSRIIKSQDAGPADVEYEASDGDEVAQPKLRRKGSQAIEDEIVQPQPSRKGSQGLGDEIAQPQLRRKGSQAIEDSNTPHTPLASPPREPDGASTAGQSELSQVKLRKVRPKEPEAVSLPEQNAFSKVKLRRVGSKEADAPASAALPPIPLRRTPSKEVPRGKDSSAAQSPFGRVSLRSVEASKEADDADADAKAPLEAMAAAKLNEEPQEGVAHTETSAVKPQPVKAEQGVVESLIAEPPVPDVEADSAAQGKGPMSACLSVEIGQEQQDPDSSKTVSESSDEPKTLVAVAELPPVAEANQSGPSRHKEIEANAPMAAQAPKHEDASRDQSGPSQDEEIEAVAPMAEQARNSKDASQERRGSPPAPALLRKSTFSQAMLRRVQSKNGQSGRAAVLGSNAKQPASPWGATLKPVKQTSENTTESNASQDKLGTEVRTFTRNLGGTKNLSGAFSQVRYPFNC